MSPSQRSSSIREHTKSARRALASVRWVAVALAFLLASAWMLYKFDQLLFDNLLLGSTPTWPVDLIDTHRQIQALFTGRNVYLTSNSAVYPPATYFSLWPLLGWVGEGGARLVWALTTVASLLWLGTLLLRATGESDSVRRILLRVLPFLLLSTGLTIGAGQMGNHILPLLLASLLLMQANSLAETSSSPWRRDLLLALLFVLALLKPTISAPFFWLILFLPSATESRGWLGRLRPALLVVTCYAALTVGMSLFVEAGPILLVRQWLEVGQSGLVWGAKTGGTNNVQAGARALGLLDYAIEFSLLVLFAWGVWIWFYRRQSRWLLFGATAIVARLWVYHRNYDDMLLLIPLIAFYRIATRDGWSSVSGRIAGIFVALALFTVVIPFGSDRLPGFWITPYQNAQVLIWLAMLGYFFVRAEQQRRNSERSSPMRRSDTAVDLSQATGRLS